MADQAEVEAMLEKWHPIFKRLTPQQLKSIKTHEAKLISSDSTLLDTLMSLINDPTGNKLRTGKDDAYVKKLFTFLEAPIDVLPNAKNAPETRNELEQACQVFLSFRGLDSAKEAEKLNAMLKSRGILTFFADETLRKFQNATQPFPPQIFRAIGAAKVAIVILSPHFFDSDAPWPREELTRILNRHQEQNLKVIVFLNGSTVDKPKDIPGCIEFDASRREPKISAFPARRIDSDISDLIDTLAKSLKNSD